MTKFHTLQKASGKKLFTILAFCLFAFQGFSQSSSSTWRDIYNSPTQNFYEIQTDFQNYWQHVTYSKHKGFKPFKRWKAYMALQDFPPSNLKLTSTSYSNFTA